MTLSLINYACDYIHKDITYNHETLETSSNILETLADDFLEYADTMQGKINALLGKSTYALRNFQEEWHELYTYLETHTVEETRKMYPICNFI